MLDNLKELGSSISDVLEQGGPKGWAVRLVLGILLLVVMPFLAYPILIVGIPLLFLSIGLAVVAILVKWLKESRWDK